MRGSVVPYAAQVCRDPDEAISHVDAHLEKINGRNQIIRQRVVSLPREPFCNAIMSEYILETKLPAWPVIEVSPRANFTITARNWVER